MTAGPTTGMMMVSLSKSFCTQITQIVCYELKFFEDGGRLLYL